MVDLVADHVLRHFQQHPEDGSYSLGMNDTNRFCQCRRCLEIASPRIEDPRARIAHAFFNAREAISDFAGSASDWNPTEARVGKTDRGWQVELRIELASLNVRPELDRLGEPIVSIARYTRRPDPQQPGQYRGEAIMLSLGMSPPAMWTAGPHHPA